MEIYGNPTSLTDGPSSYNFTTDNGCGNSATETITLEVDNIPTIELLSDSGTLSQAVCQTTDIVSITFTIDGATTSIDSSSIPSGMSISGPDAITGVYTLSGSPTTTGTTNFQIKTLGSAACSATIDISISNLSTGVSVALTSPVGTDSQQLCQTLFTTSIEPIEYLINGATDVEITGLPNGISASTFDPAAGILILSGIPTQSGIFTYEITTLPCGSIKRGEIKVSTPISISSEITQITCSDELGAISVDIIGGATTDDGLYAINWTGPNDFRQNQATIIDLAPGDYTISGTDALGCELPTQTFTIDAIEPLAVTLLSITNPTCDSGCANFEFTGGSRIYASFKLESFNPSNQVWGDYPFTPSNYYNICGLDIGLYRLTVFDSYECESDPYSFTISTENSLSIETVNIDENLCNGASGILTVEMSSLDTNLTFYYNDVIASSTYLGDNLYELIINESGLNGILKAVNSQNCADERVLTSETVNEIDLDFEFTSIEFQTSGYFEINSSIEFTNLLDMTLYNPVDYQYIVWDFDDNSPFKVFNNPEDIVYNSEGENIETVFHTYTNDGIYDVTLTVFNNAGCSISISKTIVVGKGATIMLPTVFSPNSDGLNDFFGPSFNGVKDISMYIYDSWGNLVYEVSIEDVVETNNMGEFGWNGIEPVNSEPKNEAYRCFIIAKTIDGKT
ncbi:gliding motility-associated C-terminal domain-containing protein, partial [bacterium AH-315-A23]|nr:gliding motility-associated C-terminal domain-containing protein [bacterium AH-315-A23]